MKRVNDDPEGELLFLPISNTMYDASEAINHGLAVPTNKFLFSTGLYINGYLQTNNGRRIEAALRKEDSFMIHLCAGPSYRESSVEPIRLFPNPETTDEIDVPDDFFLPYYNCHGEVFTDSRFWINPMCFRRDASGNIVIDSENIRVLLEDEYIEVSSNESWVAAILINSNNEIVHAVRQTDGRIYSKYDGYHLAIHDNLNQVDISRYGNGTFHFYKRTE